MKIITHMHIYVCMYKKIGTHTQTHMISTTEAKFQSQMPDSSSFRNCSSLYGLFETGQSPNPPRKSSKLYLPYPKCGRKTRTRDNDQSGDPNRDQEELPCYSSPGGENSSGKQIDTKPTFSSPL